MSLRLLNWSALLACLTLTPLLLAQNPTATTVSYTHLDAQIIHMPRNTQRKSTNIGQTISKEGHARRDEALSRTTDGPEEWDGVFRRSSGSLASWMKAILR